MANEFTFEGGPELLANLDRADEGAKTGARTGLLFACENVLGVATVHVPFEEGNLSRDGAASVDDEQLRAAVVYGRTADTAKYAVPVHENLTATHDDGRTAKWLENAFNTTRDQSAKILGAQVSKGMQGAIT